MAALKQAAFSMPAIKNINRLFYTPRYTEMFHADANNELLHIIDGSMRLLFESGKEYWAEKGDTLLIPRGVRHKDIFEIKQGLEIFHLSFRWNAAEYFFSKASPDCVNKLSSKDKNELLLLFDMFRLDQYDTPENMILANARLAHLLAIIWRKVFSADPSENEGKQDNYSRMVTVAHSYMRAHISERIDINSVAAYLHVSRATLIRAFHHAGGMSFNACLRSIRMQEAFYLLKERPLSVAECALQCGYTDPSHFSRTFKKHFGFSPKNII